MKNFTGKVARLMIAAAMIYGLVAPINAEAKGEKGDFAAQLEKLTPEQQTQAKALFEEVKAANSPLREAIQAKRAEIESLMKSANPDKTKLEALSREIGELRGQEMINRIQMREKFQKAGLPDLRKGGGDKPEKADKREGRAGKPDKRMDKKERYNQKLTQLTPEQQATAKQIFENNKSAMAPVREQIRAKEGELEALLKSGGSDTSRISALSTEIGELKGKMLGARIDMMQDLEKAGLPMDLFAKPEMSGDRKPGKPHKK